ncbi:MAG: uroporphyrinogen decarboxylase family protein [Prolixibacteraceae bacterium]
MNKKEKFLRFLANETIEGYLPFQPILMHFAARLHGKTYGEFASDHQVLVKSNIRALEEFDLDWVELISDPYRETSAFGAKIEYIPEGVPKCLNLLVKTIEDVHALRIPDVYKAERTLDRIKGAELYQKILKGTIPVFGWIEGPLAEACDLVGVSEMLMMLMIDPDFCNFLMDKCMVTAKAFARAQIDAGCDVIGIGDAICSQIDEITYDEFVKDRHKELVSYIQKMGARVKMHICGDINHLLPSLSELNLDILDLDSQVEHDHAFQIMGANVALCGNINPVTIQNSSVEKLEQITKSFVNAQRGKKFILSGGCEITVNTPTQNIRAMRKIL